MPSGEKATDILRKLVRDFPDVPDYRYDLAETLAAVDLPGPLVFGPRGAPPRTITEEERADALARLTESLGIVEDLVAKQPNVSDYASAQVRLLVRLAEVEGLGGRADEAPKHLERAASLQAGLADRFPEAASYRVWLALVKNAQARLRIERKEEREALSSLDSSIATLEPLANQPRMPHVRGLLAMSYGMRAEVLRGLGEGEKAEESLKKMRALRGAFPEGEMLSPGKRGGPWDGPRDASRDGPRAGPGDAPRERPRDAPPDP
jgi:tetratricopeptide (TPR) repeat protein